MRYKAWPGRPGPKYWHDAGVPNQLYGLDRVREGRREVWLVNGEPSVWACHQAGLPAVCSIAGEGHLPRDAVDRLMDHGVRWVRIAFDLDEAGERGAQRAAAALRPPLLVTVHRLPVALGHGGDVGDLYAAIRDDDAFRAAMRALPGTRYEPAHNQVAPRRRQAPYPLVRAQRNRWWLDQRVLVAVASVYAAEVRREAGRWKARCPLHDDRSPSLVLYADGRAHCFGCRWHGDAIDLVMAMEKVPFEAAVERARHTARYPSKALAERVR
jgi:DNA primase